MSDSAASSASEDRSQSESDESQQESDRKSQQESDGEDDDFDEEQGPEATAEPSAGKVKKPRLVWVTLKEWIVREQAKEKVMLEVEELARAELVPFIPAGFLK
jgi:hypothetical protein